MKPDLTPEQRKQALSSIKAFASRELDVDAGDLKAGMILDFFLKEIAPSVYNGAIRDAQKFLSERVNDLDGVCYADEFTYFKK